MKQQNTFDVIVIGGGHAGTEASLAAARIGARTLLITQSIETIGQMSCNPAIGGIGKGHLVKEVDALGGAMARAADYAGIQFRTLNARKGPAVRATRAQADRVLYKQAIRRLVEREDNLALFQQPVADLVVENDRITGVVTEMGVTFHAPAVVLTVGTFLGGRIHVGEKNFSGGRAGDPASNVLANRLRERPFRVSRLKTGTPPRIDGRTIDYSQLDEQPGEIPAPSFSFASDGSEHPRQVSCHLAYTNTRTHELIRAALHRSAMFSGNIEGVGPRYCPSIEDKIVRFADKDRHQVFVEPEGLDTNEIYPNGISTSLPLEVQVEFVRSIAGFGNAQVTRPGYAIEYDFFDPRDLKHSLETKHIAGLYFAGQINGTTGYEEAAAQGLVAGTNAARRVAGKDAWWPRRDEAYIGVLIDDLVTQGTLEPYRMFTSRAEYRLILREDNADQRLTPAGRKLGLIDDARWARFETKRDAIATETERLSGITVRPDTLDEKTRSRIGGLSQPVPAIELLRRPGVSYQDLIAIADVEEPVNDARVAEQVEVDARYAGYIKRQHDEIERQRRHETTELPAAIDYADVHGLSHEVRQKLIDLRPSTIGQAGRIPGVTPAAISLLLVHLKKRNGLKTRRKTA